MKDVPPDYYRRLRAVEERHWWHVGMRKIAAALLAERLERRHLSVLDAGCGTGGFLAWLSASGAFDRLCGVDISAEAIGYVRSALPEAELHVAPVHELPFERDSFDLVALNDVLQHVDERDVRASLQEARRVLRTDGTLFVRTNGGRHYRRERSDWRLYDGKTLAEELEHGGFRVDRMTYANALLSVWGSLRGRAPKAPTATTCGIPTGASSVANAVGRSVLSLEAAYLGRPQRRVPFGHTLFALAVPASG